MLMLLDIWRGQNHLPVPTGWGLRSALWGDYSDQDCFQEKYIPTKYWSPSQILITTLVLLRVRHNLWHKAAAACLPIIVKSVLSTVARLCILLYCSFLFYIDSIASSSCPTVYFTLLRFSSTVDSIFSDFSSKCIVALLFRCVFTHRKEEATWKVNEPNLTICHWFSTCFKMVVLLVEIEF